MQVISIIARLLLASNIAIRYVCVFLLRQTSSGNGKRIMIIAFALAAAVVIVDE